MARTVFRICYLTDQSGVGEFKKGENAFCRLFTDSWKESYPSRLCVVRSLWCVYVKTFCPSLGSAGSCPPVTGWVAVESMERKDRQANNRHAHTALISLCVCRSPLYDNAQRCKIKTPELLASEAMFLFFISIFSPVSSLIPRMRTNGLIKLWWGISIWLWVTGLSMGGMFPLNSWLTPRLLLQSGIAWFNV